MKTQPSPQLKKQSASNNKTNMKNALVKNLIIFVLVIFFIASIFSLYNVSTEKTVVIGIDKMVAEIQAGQLKKIDIKGDILELTLQDDSKQEVYKETAEPLSTLLANLGVKNEDLKKVAIEVKA